MPKKIHVTISDDLHRAVAEHAAANEEPVSTVVRRALPHYLAANGSAAGQTSSFSLRVAPPRSKADGSGR